MEKVLHVFLFFLCYIAATVAFGQGEISVTQITGGVSGSPVAGGTNNIAVFGLSFEKADGASSEITQVIVQLSAGASGKFTNPRLYRSNNTTFEGIGSEALVSTGTIGTTPDSFTFDGAPITGFGGASTLQTRNFFVVVDVDPTADGTTPGIEPSISEVDITATTTVNANTLNGTTYLFTGVAPNITGVGPGSSTCVGETITITGTGFSSPAVTINGVTATISSSNATQIEITAPGGAAIGTHQIIVENSNGNSDNSSNYTIKPPVDLGLSVTASNPSPAASVDFTINIANTQSTVNYRVRRVSPTMGSYTDTQTGNGGTRTFGPFSHSTPGVYTYRAYAISINCGTEQPLTQDVTITVAALLANAGSDEIICSGEIITLGGSPTASGGTGFYNISWTSDKGFSSTASNPTDNPNETTVYTLTVEDSDGSIDVDTKTVTVKQSTNPIDIGITLSPDSATYNKNGTAGINLNYSLAGSTNHFTHTFSGDGVVSSENKFYPGFANVGSNTIAMRFENTDNCVTNVTREISVYDPNQFVNGLDPFYCPEGTDNFTIIIPSNAQYPPPNNYVGFTDVSLFGPLGQVAEGPSWSHAGQNVQIAPGLLGPGSYTFIIEYSKNTIVGYVPSCPELYLCGTFPAFTICTRYNCVEPVYGPSPSYSYVRLQINEPPVTEIKIPQDEICRNADPITLTGSPAGGIWIGAGVTPDPINDASPQFSIGENGIASFNPASALPGINVIRYIFQDNSGCKDTTQVTINVYDVPTIDFTVGNGCVGVPLPFSPSVNIPAGVSVSEYVWDYDDEFDPEIVTTLTDPTTHDYTSSQNYNVIFTANTTDGCSVSRERVVAVGDIPDLAITWRGVCNGDDSEFEIISNFFTNTIGLVDQLDWEFGDGTSFSKNSPVLSDNIVSHQYANTGYYTAQATLTSNLGCAITKSTAVFNVPTIGTISDLNEYLEDFNGASFEDHGWKSGGIATSWEWGTPTAPLFNNDFPGGGSAWATNLAGSYNDNEKSWVHSPCFDLSQIERPVISFDYRIETRNPIDGAVLQMNANNTTDVESDWKIVGSTGNGKNWFNQNGIFANPGNQAINQSGWSISNATEWKSTVSSLDQELTPLTPAQKTKVRFRFAFASAQNESGDLPEGFIFDNVKISQRDRIILLESFTNSGGNNSPTEPNKVANQNINNNLLNESELVKIEYHVGIGGPGTDPLFLDNKTDANARAAYYGITSTPFAFIDSRSGVLQTLFDEQKLASATATIDAITTDISLGNHIQIVFTPKTDLPSNTVLRIVVVEKNISLNEQAPNGEINFTYVMKQILPNATGIQYTNVLPANIPVTETVAWPPPSKIYNANDFAIIAFLQNDLTREIYQAKILNTLNYNPYPNPDLITGIEPDFIRQILVYPNPAKDELTIELPVSLPQVLPVKLFDTYGREVYSSSFEMGVRSKTIVTQNLAAGVYILQVDSKDGQLLRRKVLVVH